MALRDRVRKLEKEAGGGTVSIPSEDGTARRFPATALQEAFLVNLKRLRGENVPPHPLSVAAAQSPDPAWNQSAYSADAAIVTAPADLSEP